MRYFDALLEKSKCSKPDISISPGGSLTISINRIVCKKTKVIHTYKSTYLSNRHSNDIVQWRYLEQKHRQTPVKHLCVRKNSFTERAEFSHWVPNLTHFYKFSKNSFRPGSGTDTSRHAL